MIASIVLLFWLSIGGVFYIVSSHSKDPDHAHTLKECDNFRKYQDREDCKQFINNRNKKHGK